MILCKNLFSNICFSESYQKHFSVRVYCGGRRRCYNTKYSFVCPHLTAIELETYFIVDYKFTMSYFSILIFFNLAPFQL